MSHRSFHLIAVMTATVSVLMVAHIAEVVVWTFAYAIRFLGDATAAKPCRVDTKTGGRFCKKREVPRVVKRETHQRRLKFWFFSRKGLLQHSLPGPDILGKMLPPQGIGHVAQSLDSVNSCKYPTLTPPR